jgi:hypothetical protein
MLKSSDQARYHRSVHRAFSHVRYELRELGLLKASNVFDRTSYFYGSNDDKNVMAWAIFVEGNDPAIMLPSRRLHKSKAFRFCLRDIFRHEFAHVIEHSFYGFFCGEFKDDFIRTFAASVSNKAAVGYTAWRKTLQQDRDYKAGKLLCRTANERKTWYYKHLLANYASEYATTNASEDFAETFMLWLKNGRDASRQRHRPGVYKKMLCIERAICTIKYQC